MKKSECSVIKLGKGEISRYREGGLSLLVYQTRDPLSDVTLVLEKERRALVMEPPCFVENLAELEQYLRTQGFKVEGLLLAYHMTGANFIKEARRYSTRNAVEFGARGRGKAMVESFAASFGSAFDSSINEVTDYIDGDSITIAGITLNIERTPDAFDFEIPAIKARYVHMLGHDVHSIIGGPGDLERELAKLERCVAKGYDLFLSSHYPAESLDDARRKIEYLRKLRHMTVQAKSAEEFKGLMLKEFPSHGGKHYLDKTAQFLFH
ncbi:MAG: hypothetical protein LBG84_08335 [Treponema sp.]|jgi:hypothetical protein|nr:hypothetical protein [Treponema sp.]